MKRREFIRLACSAIATVPTAAWSQQRPVPIVGFLKSTNEDGPSIAGFRQGLREGGFAEGSNVVIEYRWAEGRFEQLPQMASDLVRFGVTVITTPGDTPAARAAKAA